ncbi:hypothetical protein FN976_11410 [Caenimonas sedimenti]|uniref:Uncharacterized protein n=1 Tax=Caenimonas sedimenti TaxID=2596921 RepID=A0A562ZTP8_9BURK|nr:hypothetical protein [Caenimonas sedimenti]TWO71514.1 hypothetical protein FN976_11410 [Caenimonas sedimenti]
MNSRRSALVDAASALAICAPPNTLPAPTDLQESAAALRLLKAECPLDDPRLLAVLTDLVAAARLRLFEHGVTVQ